MTKLQRILGDAIESIGVYIATFLGILLSQYAPLLLKQGPIDSQFQWIRLGISAGIALYVVAVGESGGDEEGKKKNLKKRLSHAFLQGYTWSGIIGLAGQAAGG